MTNLAPHLEGSLLDPLLLPAEARERAAAWLLRGIRRAVATPTALAALSVEPRKELFLVGTVGFPTGCHTLASKRMEALECLRMGARAVEVFLDPAPVREASAGAVEAEIAALVKTVPEMEVLVSADWAGLSPRAREVLLRVVRGVRPHGVVLGFPHGGPPAGEMPAFRDLLPRKIRLTAALPAVTPDGARSLLDAGIRWVQAPAPDRLLEALP